MKEKQIALIDDICFTIMLISGGIITVLLITTMILNKWGEEPHIENALHIIAGVMLGVLIIAIASLIMSNIVKNKINKMESSEKPKTFAETLFEENKEVATKLKDPAEYDSLLSEYNIAIEAIKNDIKEKISKAIKAHPENIEVNCETLPIAKGELKLFGYQDRKDISLDIRDILEDYLVKELGFSKYQKDSYKTNCFVHYSKSICHTSRDKYSEIYEVTIYDWHPKSVKNN